MQAQNQLQQLQHSAQVVNSIGNSDRSSNKKGGLFGLMSSILTLYFSAALLGELTEALQATELFGPMYGGIVAIMIYMYYNIKKNGSDKKMEKRQYVTDYRAKYRELNPGKMDVSSSNIPVWMVVAVIGFIVFANESIGVGVLTDWSDTFWDSLKE